MSENQIPTLRTPMSGSDGTASIGSDATVHQQPLTDRLAQGAHHNIDRLAETAAPYVERIECALADATVQVKDQARLAREKGDEWTDSLRATVRRNPLSAVATAMAIGAVIARMTR